MTPALGLVATLALLAVASGTTCAVDEDCSLNGACAAGVCSCNSGWKGASCALLDRRPPTSRSTAGVWGMPQAGRPNVTSWGGNALKDAATGLHHLYVTEIAGLNCGLVSWGSRSTVVHAVSAAGLAGPYMKASVVVGHEGHNPQAVRVGGKWVIFHIGSGSAPGPPLPPCPGPPPSPAPACGSYGSIGTCPAARCRWTAGKCTGLPHPGGLCGHQFAKGYTCEGNTCSNCGGANCGPYLSLPNLTCVDNCAEEVGALCDDDPHCHSFSLENVFSGSGYKHSQTFAGNASCLTSNHGWTTFVKAKTSTSNGVSMPEPPNNGLSVSTSLTSAYVGSEIHIADSPDGPFIPLKTTYPSCNNPSPWVMNNGTIVVLCSWSTVHGKLVNWRIIAAEQLEGPWRDVIELSITPSTRMGVNGSWEDPFIWSDINGMWHALSHTYTHQPGGPYVQNSISGHLFARHIEGPWHVSPIEPYDSVVKYADHTNQTFSTMERPKLTFDESGNPIAITNGVSPVYPCDTCKGFGDAPVEGGCCWCKVKQGEDWTYTMMQLVGDVDHDSGIGPP
jgi:hypothetical protein